jgi:hypothetical protein
MTTIPRRDYDANDVGAALRDIVSAQTGITARAGGGQALATAITASFARVTTVATIGDSVRLPTARAGAVICVKNAAANSCNVFPATGDAINALGANNAFALAGTTGRLFFCAVAGTWDTV